MKGGQTYTLTIKRCHLKHWTILVELSNFRHVMYSEFFIQKKHQMQSNIYKVSNNCFYLLLLLMIEYVFLIRTKFNAFTFSAFFSREIAAVGFDILIHRMRRDFNSALVRFEPLIGL